MEALALLVGSSVWYQSVSTLFLPSVAGPLVAGGKGGGLIEDGVRQSPRGLGEGRLYGSFSTWALERMATLTIQKPRWRGRRKGTDSHPQKPSLLIPKGPLR